MTNDQETSNYPAQINTDGGTHIGNDVTTGRDFIGRDLISVNVNVANSATELNNLEATIRSRSDFLQTLVSQTNDYYAAPNLSSWIAEVKEDIARLKKRVNKLAPGTYEESQVLQSPNLHNVPQSSFFTGRAEFLDNIIDALSPETRTWVVSIDGLGGIGKTSLTKAAVYHCADRLIFDEIIWTTAQQKLLSSEGIVELDGQNLIEVDDLLDEVCRAFNYLTPLEFSFEEKLRAVKGLLKQRRSLLVLDNLETIANTKLIARFLRETPQPTKTIVTSRQLFSVGEGERFVRLPPMEETEALRLIRYEQEVKGVELLDKQAHQLYEFCNGIPAALTWSVGRMAFLTPNAVLANLQRFRYVNDFTEFCFQSAFDTIKAHNEEAAKVFLLLSLFPFSILIDSIPEITQIKTSIELEKIIKDLNLLSLIKIQDNKTISILPIVRQYAKRKLGAVLSLEKDARLRFANYLSVQEKKNFVHVFTPTNEIIPLPIGSTPVDFAYKIHTKVGNYFTSAIVNNNSVEPTYKLKDGDQVIIRVSSQSEGPKIEWAQTNRAHRNIENRHREFIKFVTPIRKANSLCRSGLLDEAESKYQSAISLNPANIWARNRLGQTLRLLGDIDRSMDEFLLVLSLDKNNSFAYSGIASLYYQRGWIEQAIENYSIALTLKPDYVNALNGIGRSMCQVKNFSTAARYFQQAIEASTQIKAQTPWLDLFSSVLEINQGESKFSDAEQILTKALRSFAKKVVSGQKLGTHTLYYYSFALMLANSTKYEEILNNAARHCFAKGLRDELMIDFQMISSNIWESWIKYATSKTSQVAIQANPDTLVNYLKRI